MHERFMAMAGWLLFAAIAAAESPFSWEDASEATGIAVHLEVTATRRAWRYGHGAGWGDVNGDGRPDLYVGAFATRPWFQNPGGPSPNMLLLSGPGGFSPADDATTRAARCDARCSGVLLADLDNDGDLDLVVGNHVLRSDCRGSELFANDGNARFRDVTPADPCWPATRGVRSMAVLDLDGDGLLDLLMTDDTYGRDAAVKNRLFVLRNRGRFRFEDASTAFGFPQGHTQGLGLAVGDVNDDGVADVFVAGSNRLFVSDGGGKYGEVLPGRFVLPPTDANEGDHCGAAFGDVNGDGLLDLVTTEHGVPARIHVFANRGVANGEPDLVEVTQSAGVGGLFPRGTRENPIKCAHVALFDVDNDGRRDIVLSVLYRDGRGRIQPVVLRNLSPSRGDTKFSPPPYEQMIGYCAAAPATDFDRDGRMDLFMASWFENLPSYLFRNVTAAGNWLTVRVEGRGRNLNAMGIGAVVRVYAAGHMGEAEHLLGRHDVVVGTGYCSSEEALAHFGLADARQCDLLVTWGERRAARASVDANQSLVIRLE